MDFMAKVAPIARTGWSIDTLPCVMYDRLCKLSDATGRPKVLE